jgi:hypothetical protein
MGRAVLAVGSEGTVSVLVIYPGKQENVATAHAVAVGLASPSQQAEFRECRILIGVLRRAGFITAGEVRRMKLDPLARNAELLDQMLDGGIGGPASVEQADDNAGHGWLPLCWRGSLAAVAKPYGASSTYYDGPPAGFQADAPTSRPRDATPRKRLLRPSRRRPRTVT